MVTWTTLPFNTPTINLSQNSALTIEFVIQQGGLPFNVSNYTVTLVTKISLADNSPLFSINGSISDGPNGIVHVALSSAHTATARTLIAELELTNGSISLTPIQFYLGIEAV